MKIRMIFKLFFIAIIFAVVPFCTAFATLGEVTGNGVRLRKDPSTNSKIITLLEKGKTVEVITKKEGWYNVKVGNYSGWVSENLLSTNEEEKIANDNAVSILAVTGSSVNLRKEPSTSALIVGKVVEGDNLISCGKTADGQWYKVKFSDVEGYIFAEYVSEDLSEIVGDGTINDGVNFRKEPSTTAEIIGKLSTDSKVTIVDCKDDWYKVLVNDMEGWVVARCVDRVTQTSRSGGNLTAQKVVEIAKKQLGKKYVWGTEGPKTFDCSGLTQYVYGSVGIKLNRVSTDQATQGIAVSKANLKPGDLLCFSGINAQNKGAKVSHVGIYIGSGKFIHAANSNRGVVIDELEDSYYQKH